MPRVTVDDPHVVKHWEMPLVEIRCNVLIPFASERVLCELCFKRRDVLNQCLEFDGWTIGSEE
ncbi:hypothetical protein C497_02332 [Halalkalicoccus jeotgali B3]|uniref:Uncharacterized protein n=1 Tax=Halalkalicoccus jeotgali (strain DSM 18796 / CECT 7217 / JCM 14584 / KCTC 4019 / B3) TaxID=795797 RepID=D8JBU6_HALJB|nr:hypothetical protein [Halalkalicoccus jeotgali]ADJ16749.1 hypothetical protein HacjB3_16996 [Halalkalicoccus jeotgali B3]ELY40883.1 hypothetical protein C497_02332 [Halalkalicoccus jeotgali B3]